MTASSTNDHAASTPGSGGTCRILIADDELFIATGLSAMVSQLGYQVAGIAADGEQAITLAQDHLPDLALLDIRMPKVNGIEAAAAIFEKFAIPTIIVSAYSDEEHLQRIVDYPEGAGVYGYLLKPVSADDLRVTIGVVRRRAEVDAERRKRLKQLNENIANRRLVEQAKWILVDKLKLSEPQAHDKLQKTARDRRKPLCEIAQIVVDTGSLPV